MAEMSHAGEKEVVGAVNVGWRADPGDGVAELLDGVDEGADVAGDVVEEVDCSLGLGFWGRGGSHGSSRRGGGQYLGKRNLTAQATTWRVST